MTTRAAVTLAVLALASGAGCVEPLALENHPCPCKEPEFFCCLADPAAPVCVARAEEARCQAPDAAAPATLPDAASAEAAPAKDAGPTADARADAPADAPARFGIQQPAARAVVRGTTQVVVNVPSGSGKVELFIDGQLRKSWTAPPYQLDWATHDETLGTHATGAHRLRAVAGGTSDEIEVFVVAAAAGDCNQDGVVDQADRVAIGAEITDGDGSDPDATGGGTHPGNPGCDANQDNLVDENDARCVLTLIAGDACFDAAQPQVAPLVFVPTDYASMFGDDELVTFFQHKVEEVRRFYARHGGGMAFRALPVTIVRGLHDHAWYWGPDSRSVEPRLLNELTERGLPTHEDWALPPWNRVLWIAVMGAGGSTGARHYPTGHGLAWFGDAILFAGLDRDCHRVQPPLPGDPIKETCTNVWARSNIYGFGVGAMAQLLGYAFNLPAAPPGTPEATATLMGEHWRYPATGLGDRERAILGTSHFFPGALDRERPVARIVTPAADAIVSGIVTVEVGATDDYGLKSLTLLVDGMPVATPPRTPFQGNFGGLAIVYEWDTRQSNPAPAHTIVVRAEDVFGNTAESGIEVGVKN